MHLLDSSLELAKIKNPNKIKGIRINGNRATTSDLKRILTSKDETDQADRATLQKISRDANTLVLTRPDLSDTPKYKQSMKVMQKLAKAKDKTTLKYLGTVSNSRLEDLGFVDYRNPSGNLEPGRQAKKLTSNQAVQLKVQNDALAAEKANTEAEWDKIKPKPLPIKYDGKARWSHKEKEPKTVPIHVQGPQTVEGEIKVVEPVPETKVEAEPSVVKTESSKPKRVKVKHQPSEKMDLPG